MSVLRLTCSPRGAASESHRLSRFILDGLARADARRGRDLVEIDANPLPHVDAEYAWALGSPADPDGDPAGSLRQSDHLINPWSMPTTSSSPHRCTTTPCRRR